LTQGSDFVLGKNNQRSSATLWALLQVNVLLVLPSFPLGAICQAIGVVPTRMQPVVKIERNVEVEVRYLIQPVTDQVRFEKARSGPSDTLAPEGTLLAVADRKALERTVGRLQLGRDCHATVTLDGFDSDEEFGPSGIGSNRKNLEVADHRASAVYEALSGLPEVDDGWLIVKQPERWLPAKNTEVAIKQRWSDLRAKRKKLVPQPGTQESEPDGPEPNSDGAETNPKRDPQRDRVVVLQWKQNEPCKVTVGGGGTVTEAEESS